jgi:transposase
MFGMGKNNRNRYSEEFKEGAVKLVMENKQSISEVCRSLGVSRNAMDRWLAAEADSNDDEKVRLHQLGAGNKQIRKDKADLEDTVEILKKRRPSCVQKKRQNVLSCIRDE